MTNRLHKYRLNDEERRLEQQIIEQIAVNNGYETSIIKQLNKPRHMNKTDNTKISWAKFTYFGRHTLAITKLFKETQL
jgi:tRNA U34 5-carboxymethylaminomethyl modifying enzyme MnmG/GidA